jgi:hypothetical protein
MVLLSVAGGDYSAHHDDGEQAIVRARNGHQVRGLRPWSGKGPGAATRRFANSKDEKEKEIATTLLTATIKLGLFSLC